MVDISDCLSNGIFGKVKNSTCAFFGGFRIDKKIYFLFLCYAFLFGKAKNSTVKAKNSTAKAKNSTEKAKNSTSKAKNSTALFFCFV